MSYKTVPVMSHTIFARKTGFSRILTRRNKFAYSQKGKESMKPTKLSPVAFLLAILCFALPFVTVSCNGQPFVKLSGVQLVTGTTIHGSGPFAGAGDKKVEPVGFAGFAFVCALAGMTLTVMKSRKGPLFSAGLAVLSAASLLLMKSVYDQQITQQSFGMAVVGYGAGFTLTLLFLTLGAVSSFLQYRLQEKPPGYLGSSPYAPPA
jgi:hypothetical protein